MATVVDGYKKVSNVQRTNGKIGAGHHHPQAIQREHGRNRGQRQKDDRRAHPELPSDVTISVASDASVFTRNSLSDVQHELTTAIALTGLVLLLFLHSFRSTLIVLLTIPTSLIATLGVMYFLGLSLNMMSLMGLTLTVGILVDDSIVVLENIFRHLQMGEGPREAAINGRGEIGFAAIAITLVDVVVFTPIAFMSGIVGQYFREFGLVIVSATLFSLFVSFTLTPLLASRWYQRGRARRRQDSTSPRAIRWCCSVARGTAATTARGRLRARLAVRDRPLDALGWSSAWASLSFVGGIMLVATGVLSTEFFPPADDGELQVNLEMPPGTTLDITDAATQKIEQRIQAWPEVKEIFTSVGVNRAGGFGTSGGRFSTITVELIPKKDRVRTPADPVPGSARRSARTFRAPRSPPRRRAASAAAAAPAPCRCASRAKTRKSWPALPRKSPRSSAKSPAPPTSATAA